MYSKTGFYIALFNLQGQIVLNKPYDESVEISDGEEVTSAQASPREQPTQQVKYLNPNIMHPSKFCPTYPYAGKREDLTKFWPQVWGFRQHF